jgi:glycerate-2-kinase
MAARAALLSHNSYDYLKAHDQLLMVGATGTNLADLVLIIAQD